MSTYKTYQEAKIANPGGHIFISMDRSKFAGEEYSNSHPQLFRAMSCNPAHYCVTVENFLADGLKLSVGDSVINGDGHVHAALTGANVLNMKYQVSESSKCYILRAAALEEITKEKETFAVSRVGGELKLAPVKAKPRTKVTYERVKLEDTIEIIDGDACIDSDLYYKWGTNNIVEIKEVSAHDLIMNRHKLVRKAEAPIEWWEDAAEFAGVEGHTEINGERLLVEAAMTRDQWCDFARILLEQDGAQDDSKAITALFGMAGYLTSLDHPITFSGHHWATPAADLVAEIIKANNLVGECDFDSYVAPELPDTMKPQVMRDIIELVESNYGSGRAQEVSDLLSEGKEYENQITTSSKVVE